MIKEVNMNEKILIGIITVYMFLQLPVFFLYGLDKSRAKRSQDGNLKKDYGKNGIPERFLLQMSILSPIGAP